MRGEIPHHYHWSTLWHSYGNVWSVVLNDDGFPKLQQMMWISWSFHICQILPPSHDQIVPSFLWANAAFLPFRSLCIFVLSTTPQSTQLYKWATGYRHRWKCVWIVFAHNCCMARMLPREVKLVSEWTGLPGRAKSVKRFEPSNGLDTALYKNIHFYICIPGIYIMYESFGLMKDSLYNYFSISRWKFNGE